MDDFAKEVITKMETYEKKEKRQFNKYDMAIGLFYGVGTVSYTHLDVYKRQQHALFYKSLCQNQIIGNLEYWDKRHRYYARKLLQSCLLYTSRCV